VAAKNQGKMKKIIVSNLISVDGCFEGPNHELDWFVVEEEFFEYCKAMLNSVDTILFGRVTYEMMAAYWPVVTDEDPAITHKMNHLDKVVFSRTLSGLKWNNSRLARRIDPEEISFWKRKPGKDIVILGSSTIVSALAQLGLIDEYRFIINPLLVGKGNRLFNELSAKLPLTLKKTQVLGSGVVILYYEPSA
jgi:dihydrofolate reductase